MEFYATVTKHYNIDGHIVVKVNGNVILSEYIPRNTTLNTINLALAYGKLVKEDENQMDYTCTVKIHRKSEKRFSDELNILINKDSPLGAVGYILGLHSGVFVSVDSRTKEKISRGEDLYSATWEGMHFTTGSYMPTSLHKSVVDEMRIPENSELFEDYIYMKQLKREVKIPDIAYEKMLSELDYHYKHPWHILYRVKTIKSITLRFVGMIPGILVQHGFKEDITKVSAILTEKVLTRKIHDKFLKVWHESIETAKKLGDL